MIKTLAIVYFVTSAILFAIFYMALFSMIKQATESGYFFPKQKQDLCRRFLSGVLLILFFCVPIIRWVVPVNTATAAVLGIETNYGLPSRLWDNLLESAQYQR